MVMAALMAALTCVATLAFQIPLPGSGYVHLGDAAVLISGWLLGPVYGAIAAGLGSMLADVFSGYLIYAPATLIIKALSALLAGICLRKISFPTLLLSGLCGGIIVPVGYFLYEIVLLGFSTAIIDVVGIAIKEVICLVVAIFLMLALNKTRLFK